jgi:hypothetical protein
MTEFNCSDYDVTNVPEAVSFAILILINAAIVGYIIKSLYVIK